MHFRCPNQNCQNEFDIPNAHLGDKVTCPDCGTRFVAGEYDLGDLSELPAADSVPTSGKQPEAAPTLVAEAPKKSADALIGKVLGGCRVTKKLGEGGMGAVYKAHHEGLDIDVAMKVLPVHLASQNPEFIERFRREAKVAARLHHAHVVNVMNVGEEQGQNFIIMEFVEGEDLKAYLEREGKLDVHIALDIITQVFEALDAGHSVGILHRDIKPANVFLTKGRGGKLVAKLGDFGLAKIGAASSDDASSGNTMSGMMMGTPHYISPEQAEDAKRVDARADIYSMGCMLYYMLCGRVPYDGEGFVQIVLQHMQSPVPDPRKIRSDLPAELAAIVMKMMAKKAGERFQAAAEVLDMLEKLRKGLAAGDTSNVGIKIPVPTAAPPTVAPQETTAPTAKTIACPHADCGKETSADADWCEFCGRSLFEECRNCKRKVRALRTFCPYCRYDLNKSREIYKRIEACKKHAEGKLPASVLEEASAVLALESKDAEALQFKQEAETALREVTELKENAEEAFTLKDYDSVQEFFQNALEITPHDEDLKTRFQTLPDRIRQRELNDKLVEAREAQNNRLPRQALAAFEQALKFVPDAEEALKGKKDSEDILAWIAQIKEQAGALPEEDLQAQFETWSKVLELDVSDEKARQHHTAIRERLNQAREYARFAIESRRSKDWESSFNAWQEALSIWPICPEATTGVKITERLQAANQFLDEKRLQEALEQADAALQISPECPDSLRIREDIQGLLNQVQELKARAEEATSPDDYDAALEMIEEAIAIYPHDESLHDKFADLKERIRVRDFERNLAEGKAAWESYLPRQAFQAFQRALGLEPSSPEAREGLEKCQNVLNQVEDLTATARQHEQNGELDQAIAIWDHIVALDPESQKAPEIRKKLGTELTAAKDFIAKAQQEVETRDWGKALHQWEKALKLWPACPEAQNGRDQAAQQLEQFKQLFAQTKQLAKEHRLTSALETHRQALGIGISDEALELQDQMESAHQQAEVMSQAGTGAAGQSLWREAAAKLQSAWALNRESVNEGELDKARKLAAKVQTHLDKSQALLKDGYFQDAEAEAQKGLEYGPDLKLQEVASESGRRSQRVQEAVNEAEECEPQNPPQAVKLWQEVLSLQPVHAVAPERIRKLQERIGNAQQKFDEARNWEAKKKWAKMLLAGQEAQAINPAIPDISAFIQRASSNYRKQKIILATATAAAILVIIAVTTKATIESFNSKSYEKWMGEGKAKLASEDWSAAQAAFGKAKTAFVFAKQDKGKLAGGLETLASGIVEADKQVTQAKKLADTQEKDWKKVAEAYERARGSLKGIDLKPVAELQKWLQKWETEEYQASDKYCESLQAPKTRAEILGTFLKSHPEAKNRKSVETRIKNYLQEHFDTSYQGLADRFEQDFLFKEKEKDCQEMLEQLKKLVEEARKDGITIRIPPHRTIAVLTETFAKADQVRAIKQAVQRAKAAFKQAQTPKDKIAVWAGFRTQYPGQEAETILGEIADEYNSLVRRFEGILAKDEAVFGMAEAVEAATASSLASALVDEATKAAFNFTIANPESKPDALAQRIAPKKAAVEDKAFGTANADAQAAKTPQEKIEVWEKFLTSFPKNLFGKHYRDALQSKYEPHVEICTKAMETSDFAEADKELSKAEALFKQAEEGGMALTVLPEKQPAILREKLDYSIAKAGAAKAADPFAEIAAWEKYLQAQPSSSQAPQARQARQKAYTAAYSSLLKSFDENLKKKTDQGFAQAEKDKETAQTLLQKAVAAKYDPKSIASDRTPDNLQTDWTSAKNAFEEETAFTAATTSANEQLKSQKFDDAISTWEGFIAKKYPPGNFSDKAKAELNKARQAAVDSYVAEGQKAFASNKLSDAYKQVQNALRYLPDARNALDLQKQIIPKLILASGVFEIPTEDKDPFGNPAMKGEDDKTGYPREIRHKNSQMLFIFVPAGEFMMGDPKNADGDNPQHPVSISKPFYLGKYEVTLKEIKVFDKADNNSLTQDVTRRQEESDKTAKAMKQDPISISSWLNPGFKQEDSHPAVHITLAYIDKFLKWMNRDYGKELFQLPTEAQWEYACRAGSTTEFFWGDDEEAGAQCANFKGNSTQPVGSKKPNAFGLYDVIGNAMEWCQDWYDGNFYASSPKNEPVCQQKTDNRACRGGAFADRGKKIRAAYRNKNKPTYDSNTMGFRLCIDASATTEKSTVFAAGSK